MEKYYLIKEKRLVKGVSEERDFVLASTAYEFIDGAWVMIDVNDINDRLMGYDPFEDGPYAIGNTDIMDTIRKITPEEARKIQGLF